MTPKERAKNYMMLKDGYKEKKTIEEENNSVGVYQQKLFSYLHELGIISLQSEMQEIERIVLDMQKEKNTKELDYKFTIEFTKWYDLNYFVYNTFTETTTIEEMLEIFKKEKGL